MKRFYEWRYKRSLTSLGILNLILRILFNRLLSAQKKYDTGRWVGFKLFRADEYLAKQSYFEIVPILSVLWGKAELKYQTELYHRVAEHYGEEAVVIDDAKYRATQ